MGIYELTYIISGSFPEDKVSEIAEKVKKLLPEGKIVEEKSWGKRELAYPILKNKFGFYTTLVFESRPDLINSLESKLKLEEGVIRYLIVKKEKPKELETEKKVQVKEPKKKKTERKAVVTKPKEKTAVDKKKEKIAKEISEEILEEKLEEILKE